MEGRYQQIRTTIGGRTYSGDWTLDGRQVCVGSAYGSRRSALVGRAKPERRAEALLREIVEAWRQGRA